IDRCDRDRRVLEVLFAELRRHGDDVGAQAIVFGGLLDLRRLVLGMGWHRQTCSQGKRRHHAERVEFHQASSPLAEAFVFWRLPRILCIELPCWQSLAADRKYPEETKKDRRDPPLSPGGMIAR